MPGFIYCRLHLSTTLAPSIILLGAILLGAMPLQGFAAEASPSAKILKFGYILTPESQLGEGEKVFADEVAARTGGRYVIEDYPNAMLGGEVAMMTDVQLGALDIAFITGAALPNILPEAGVFNIPFLFHDANEARLVLDGPIGAEYFQKFQRAGVIALAWGENGMRHMTSAKRPIRTPEDLNGLKLRVPQSDVIAAAFEAAGSNVQQIPFQQTYSALRSSKADAEENPIATILSARFYEVQHYLTLTGHIYDPAIIIMSDDAFAALPDADKRVFKEAARLAALKSREVASEKEKSGIATLKANGMLVEDSVDKAAFMARMASASDSYEKRLGRDLIERVKNAAAQSHAPGAESQGKQ